MWCHCCMSGAGYVEIPSLLTSALWNNISREKTLYEAADPAALLHVGLLSVTSCCEDGLHKRRLMWSLLKNTA
jgi:hypothetical protein